MSSCFDSEGVYYRITQAWFRVPCIESFITMKVYPCSVNLLLSRWLEMIRTTHSNTKRSPWKSERESFFFWIAPFMMCCLYVWMVRTRAVTFTSAVKWFAMYPSVLIVFWFIYSYFCLCSHNSVNLLLGYQVWGG